MPELKVTKEELKKMIDEAPSASAFREEYWRYPKAGDDQKTCPMLDVMFRIEHKGGIIIHIPFPGNGNRDKEFGG